MTSCPARDAEPSPVSRPISDTLTEAGEFLQTCRTELGTVFASEERLNQITEEIKRTGTYRQSLPELQYGGRLAWRNALDCLGKGMWRRLDVRDCRHAVTPDSIFAACIEHLRIATRHGRIKAVMTVLPPASPDGAGVRIWNKQLVRYAGYREPDGSIIGDPDTVGFTEAVGKLGWRGARTRFDILPIAISVPGDEIRWYPVPPLSLIHI